MHPALARQVSHLVQALTESREDLLAEYVDLTLGVVEGDPGDPPLVDAERRISVGRGFRGS